MFSPRLTNALAVLTLVMLSGQRAYAGEVPKAVTEAHGKIQAHVAGILNLAYPTAKGMIGNTEATYEEDADGYALDEKFAYRDSDGDRMSFKLRFKLDRTGSVASMSISDHTSFWPPFSVGEIVLQILKAAAQSNIDAAHRAGREPSKGDLLIANAGEFKDVLPIMINYVW